jgi:hypothetical protein
MKILNGDRTRVFFFFFSYKNLVFLEAIESVAALVRKKTRGLTGQMSGVLPAILFSASV